MASMAVAVAVEEASVRPGGVEWTVDLLDQLPDDGLKYELLDGILLVSPAPIHLDDAGSYTLIASAAGGDQVTVAGPLTVTVIPNALVAD